LENSETSTRIVEKDHDIIPHQRVTFKMIQWRTIRISKPADTLSTRWLKWHGWWRPDKSISPTEITFPQLLPRYQTQTSFPSEWMCWCRQLRSRCLGEFNNCHDSQLFISFAWPFQCAPMWCILFYCAVVCGQSSTYRIWSREFRSEWFQVCHQIQPLDWVNRRHSHHHQH
jgi:hypothetical protein